MKNERIGPVVAILLFVLLSTTLVENERRAM